MYVSVTVVCVTVVDVLRRDAKYINLYRDTPPPTVPQPSNSCCVLSPWTYMYSWLNYVFKDVEECLSPSTQYTYSICVHVHENHVPTTLAKQEF